MNTVQLYRSVVVSIIVSASFLAPLPGAADPQEVAIGQKTYEQINGHGLILRGTTYNRILEPIAVKIEEAARDLYDEPFRFFVIHDDSPNAFAVPGGYMFINDSLMNMISTKDELAGVMCHEISHVIHHDGINEQRAAQNRAMWATLGSVVLRGGAAANAAGATYVNLANAHFSRKAESAADITGTDICAKAGYNPNGLVWMMLDFEKLSGDQRHLEMLSSHPREDHRISDMQAHFAEKPSTFSQYQSDLLYGAPLLAKGYGSGLRKYAGVICPVGLRSGINASDFDDWAKDATPNIKINGSEAGRLTIDDPLAFLPGESTWFKSELGISDDIMAAYDPTRKVLVTCRRYRGGQSLDAYADIERPPFQVATYDLSDLKTKRGISLGSPLEAITAVYGAGKVVPLKSGLQSVAYQSFDAGDYGVRVQYVLKAGKVVAIHRAGSYKTIEVVPLKLDKHNDATGN